MPSIIGLHWPDPSTVQALDALSDQASHTSAITSDGATIFGYSTDGSPTFLRRPVRWDGTTLTRLFDIDASQNSEARYCSPDGSIIVGTASNQGAMWTSGGTAGALLTPVTGYTSVLQPGSPKPAGGGVGQRIISDDGTIVVGTSHKSSGDTNRATIWTSGAPAQAATVPVKNSTVALGCNNTGTTAVGYGFTVGSTQWALYWTAGTETTLNGTGSQPLATCLLDDASVIFGFQGNLAPTSSGGCYWDTLGTPGGVIHLVSTLPSASNIGVRIGGCCPAVIGGVPVSFGNGVNSTGHARGIRWRGTTAEELAPLGGGLTSSASGISADGQFVFGNTSTLSTTEPCYWDVAGTPHLLPTVADGGDPFLGQAFGVDV